MNEDIQFHQAIFDSLGATMAALLDRYEAAYGHVFSTADLKWRENFDPKTQVQSSALMWKNTALLEMELDLLTFECRCTVAEVKVTQH